MATPARKRSAPAATQAPEEQDLPPAKAKKGAKPPKEKKQKLGANADASPKGEWAALREQVTKERGTGIIHTANKIPLACHSPTGAFILDFATLGGIPEGFGFMYFGLQSSGKTTMMLKAVAGMQRKYPDKIVVWCDPESLFDPEWASILGCDLDRLEVIQPDTGEETVDILTAAMEALEVSMVVLDSVPACVPKAVIDRSAEDDTMASLARLMGKCCSKILMAWAKERRRGHRVTVGIINQIRSKVGFVLGNPETRPGGRQINHLPALIIKLGNKEIKGTDAQGLEVVDTNDHTFLVEKSKHGASIRSGEFQMVINPDLDPQLAQGEMDDFDTVVNYAKRFKLVQGGGGKYRIPLIAEDETWAKYEDIVSWLKDNNEAYLKLQAALIALQRISKGIPAFPPDGFLVDASVELTEEELAEYV